VSTEYPDVLGDLVDARHRFEVNGVHYLMALQPPAIRPGGTTALRVWLQSCWDVPVEVAVRVQLPASSSSTFSLIQQQTDVLLQPAEVGELTIPIACAAEARAGEHSVPVTVGVKHDVPGLYVRSQANEGHLGDTLLTFTTGLALAATMGLGYVARTQATQGLPLRVEGSCEPEPVPDLTPTFLSHWSVDDLLFQGKARQYVNDQRLYLQPKLTTRALYVAFLEESQERFRDASLPLHIGEAIFLAKILTYAVEYFLKRPGWQDAILIPAYTLAFRHGLPTSEPVFLVVRADFARLARLACSLSFGLLRQHLKRDLWTMEEQLAVSDLLTARVARGGSLPAEFLYLPLVLGGLLVATQVQMPGENLEQGLDLLAQARQRRNVDLAQNQDLVAILDRLLQLAPPAS
jgi:hypothetical protein